MQGISRLQLWRSWLALPLALVVLLVLLIDTASQLYQRDQTVVYWLLVSYSYPDATVELAELGLLALGLAIVLTWVSLGMLARSGLAPLRAWGMLALTAVAVFFAFITFFVSVILGYRGPDTTIPLTLAFGALTAVAAFLVFQAVRELGPSRRLIGALAIIALASLLVMTVTPLGLLLGERPNSYDHLTGASYQGRRYQLTREDTPSDGSLVLLFRCDALGLLCHEVDHLGTISAQSQHGYLRYDATDNTITATEGAHTILSYPAGDLFRGP